MSSRILAAALCLFVLGSARAPEQDQKPHLWFRIWPDYLVKYDMETDEVVTKVKTLRGVCHDTVLSHDKKFFFLVTGKRTCIEVLDIEKGEIIEGHVFDEGAMIHRISSVREIPGGTHWYVKIDRVRREIDHFVIEKPEWLLYDVEQKLIEERMSELPKTIRRGARISPDGTKWHVFGKDITIVDPETLEEEGKIELSKPLYTGLGAISVRGEDFFDGKNPDAYRMMYTMRDPVQTSRTLMGVVDIDVAGRKVAKLTEWGASLGVFRLRMTADKKVGFGQKRGRDRGTQSNGDDPIITMVSVDLETGKKLDERRIDVRNGLSFSALSPDGSKIYMSGRGHELVVYDNHFNYVKTVELEGELDGRLHVVGP